MRLSLITFAASFSVQAFARPDLARFLQARDADVARALELATKQQEKNHKRSIFDPASQLVSVSGQYAYKAPGTGDMRGPCPGLNTLANHGYIARNGYTNVAEANAAMHAVYGMSLDVATLLSVLGAVQAGDGYSFSIGGPPPANLLNTLGLIGQPQGLSNSHNRFESDQSISRNDLYRTGDDVTMNLNFFTSLYNMSPGPYTLQHFGQHCVNRFNYEVANNPYFFKGFVAQFIPETTSSIALRNFANKSAANPDGALSRANLMSFYGVTQGSNGALTYNKGTERIPNNFYKFNDLNQYSLVTALGEMAEIYAMYPGTVQFGGNTGTVNSFTGFDLANLTGGIFNGATLLQGNNLACFVLQTLSFFEPDVVRNAGILKDVLGAVANVTNSIGGVLNDLACPQVAKFDKSIYNAYPGWTKSNN